MHEPQGFPPILAEYVAENLMQAKISPFLANFDKRYGPSVKK